MKKHTTILLSFTVLLIITKSWWQFTNIEYGIALVGILLAGVPHGAMDHFTASYLNGVKFNLTKYVLQYILAVGFYIFIWWLFPSLAFILFLVFTAWHFGETDLVYFASKKLHPIIIFIYGFTLCMWLLLHHPAEILSWTNIITGDSYYASTIIKNLSAIPHFIWLLISAALIVFVTYKSETKNWTYALTFILLLFAISQTSLIVGFVVYFSGWHSIKALHYVNLSVFKQQGIKKLVINALPATLGSVLLLAILLLLGNKSWMENAGLPSLFVLLSALTLPHMVQMHKLYDFRLKNKAEVSTVK
jgi:beta-carotene 15,15'-dioxygenase